MQERKKYARFTTFDIKICQLATLLQATAITLATAAYDGLGEIGEYNSCYIMY